MSLCEKIGIGTVQFGMPYGISNQIGRTVPEEVTRILNYSQLKGIKYIDTASSYGVAENILGMNNLEPFQLISKFMPPTTTNSITRQLNETLDKFKCKSIYGYLVHSPQNLMSNLNQWDELLFLKQMGLANKIGFSLNVPGELDYLLDKGLIPDLIQVPYNYFDNRFKKKILELKNIGCEIHTRSTFLQGLFFLDHNKLPLYFDEVKHIIKELQVKYQNNLSGVLLKYVLDLEFVDVVIIGVENLNQLKNNLINLENHDTIPDNNFNISDSILIPSNWP